jgi:hypothetical protein
MGYFYGTRTSGIKYVYQHFKILRMFQHALTVRRKFAFLVSHTKYKATRNAKQEDANIIQLPLISIPALVLSFKNILQKFHHKDYSICLLVSSLDTTGKCKTFKMEGTKNYGP